MSKKKPSIDAMVSLFAKLQKLPPKERLDFYSRLRCPPFVRGNAAFAFDPRVSIDRLEIDASGMIGLRKPKVFLSHNSADKPSVRAFARRLKRGGIDYWLDEAEILHGESLIKKIGAAIDGVDVVLAFISKHSVKSPWVQRELEIAITREIQGRNIRVVPVLLQKVELPPFLVGKLYADLTSPETLKTESQRVIKSIKLFLSRSDNDA